MIEMNACRNKAWDKKRKLINNTRKKERKVTCRTQQEYERAVEQRKSDKTFEVYRKEEDKKYEKYKKLVKQSPEEKIHLVFHAGCHGCKAPENFGVGYCIGCQYFNYDWDFPDISSKDGKDKRKWYQKLLLWQLCLRMIRR